MNSEPYPTLQDHLENFRVNLPDTVGPDRKKRLEAGMRYGTRPPLEYDVTPQTFEVTKYYSEYVILPKFPEGAAKVKELTYGLMAVYDKQGKVLGVMDFQDRIDQNLHHKLAQKKYSELLQLDFIDFKQLDHDAQKNAFLDLFISRGVQISEEDLPQAIEFFAEYQAKLRPILEEYNSFQPYAIDHKSFSFKAAYRMSQYLEGLDHTQRQQYNQLMEAWRDGYVTLFESDVSLENITTLSNQLFDIANYDPDMLSQLLRQVNKAYINLGEVEWMEANYTNENISFFRRLHQSFDGEKNNALMESLVFMIKELHSQVRGGDATKIDATADFFSNYFENFMQIFNPEFIKTKLNIDPRMYDKLLTMNIRKGRENIRDMLSYSLWALAQTLPPPPGSDKKEFFTALFEQMKSGAFKAEKTGDTYIEARRNKNAVEYLRQQGLIPTADFTAVEVGIGTGRMAQELAHVFPEMKLHGIDIVPPEILRQFGLPEKFPCAGIDLLDLTPEKIKEAFGIEKTDVIFLPWSVLSELDLSQLEKAFLNLRTVTNNVIYDIPAIASAGYMEMLSSNNQAQSALREKYGPYTTLMRLPDGSEDEVHLFPIEVYEHIGEKVGLSHLNLSNKEGAQRERELERLRKNNLPRSTDPIKHPGYRTTAGRKRLTMVATFLDDKSDRAAA